MTSRSPHKPGLLLVHPRLHDSNTENAATFLRWTKLHFRDLLNLPDTGSGRVTRDLRFVAPDGDEKEGQPKYLYTCLVEDIAFLKSEPYYAVSRKLNLEQTRSLEEGEEAVGGDGEEMVFDLVSAHFAVFEQVSAGWCSFPDIPVSLTNSKGGVPKKSSLVVLNINTPTSSPNIPRKMQAALFELLDREPPSLSAFSSVYKWSGEEAQPENHPLIDKDERGEWMLMFLVVDKVRDVRQREHLVKMIGGYVGEESMKKDEREGVEVGFGVWTGEVFMS